MTTVDDQTRKAGASDPVAAEIERLKTQWPQEYRLGWRFGFLRKADQPCTETGYPIGLRARPLGRKNAWWCGWNQGHNERARLREKRR